MIRQVLLLLILLSATAASALDGYALNPANTDALVYNKLELDGSVTRACLNMTPLLTDPTLPPDGDFWCVHSVSTHHCCFQDSSTKYCFDLIVTP